MAEKAEKQEVKKEPAKKPVRQADKAFSKAVLVDDFNNFSKIDRLILETQLEDKNYTLKEAKEKISNYRKGDVL